ncbi:MAG: glycerophosphodiester phosphodiesterase [Chloroflexi bacterium]|nr:glycerophosphodiester phosphodiesterase [Chloroflexota bacterium]
MDGPILIAHRGGSLEAPENSMAAFRHAIEIGMRFVELDVQMSRDGVLMVIHDESVNRTTEGRGAVGGLTYEELRRLDVGSKFGAQFMGEKIPTLREVLELCLDAGVGVVVELKSPGLYDGMEEKVAALIGEIWIRGGADIWCISFDHDALRRMRELDPALLLGYLYAPSAESFVQPDDTVQAYCPFYRTALAHPEEVEQAHRLGKHVLVYTVNEEDEMLRVAEAGIDGMVSDRPTLLLEVLGER